MKTIMFAFLAVATLPFTSSYASVPPCPFMEYDARVNVDVVRKDLCALWNGDAFAAVRIMEYEPQLGPGRARIPGHPYGALLDLARIKNMDALMLLGTSFMNPEWGIPFIAGSPYGAKAKTVHDDLYAEGCCYNRLLSYAYLYLAADLYGNEEAAEYVAQLQNILKPGEQKTIHSWFEQFEVFPNVGSYYKPTKMLPLDFSHLKPAH